MIDWRAACELVLGLLATAGAFQLVRALQPRRRIHRTGPHLRAIRWLASRGLLVRFVLYAVALLTVTALTWLGTRRELDPPAAEDFASLAELLGRHLCESRADLAHLALEANRVRAHLHVPIAVDTLDGTELVSPRYMAPELVHGARLQPLSRPEVERLRREHLHQIAAQTFVSACITDGNVDGYVLVGRPPVARYAIPPFSPPLMALLLVLGFIPLARSIVRPVERITAAARSFGQGDLRARIGMNRRDELGTLACAFDDMASRLEALVRSERELLANVSHELRTPLARIRVVLELAADGDGHDIRRYLAEIAHDLGELERLVDDILTSARLAVADANRGVSGPPLRWARVEIAELVEEVANRFRARHPGRSLRLESDTLLEAIDLDAMMVRRAIENVLDNAVTHSLPGQPVVLRVHSLSKPRPNWTGGGRGFEATVEDSGVGMAPAELSQLFTPFFRADSSRTRSSGGVGLGLVLARSIARAHGGDVRVESAGGVGTVVCLTFYGPDGGKARREI